VLDLWVRQWRRRHAHGRVVRYAGDFVMGPIGWRPPMPACRASAWLDTQVGLSDARIEASGRAFNDVLDEFEQALWDAGK
jgi:hypothetical protein